VRVINNRPVKIKEYVALVCLAMVNGQKWPITLVAIMLVIMARGINGHYKSRFLPNAPLVII